MGKLFAPDPWSTRGYAEVEGSELLDQLAGDAEEAGRDPEIVLDHDRDGVVRSVILDGVEYENSVIREEQDDYDYHLEIRRYGN